MFDKEAEEYQTRKHHQRLYGNKPVVMKELNIAYKDGFKDGYNKANEWHYVKDGIFPTHSYRVLVFTDLMIKNGIHTIQVLRLLLGKKLYRQRGVK